MLPPVLLITIFFMRGSQQFRAARSLAQGRASQMQGENDRISRMQSFVSRVFKGAHSFPNQGHRTKAKQIAQEDAQLLRNG